MICKDTDEIARKLKHNGIEISWMQLMNSLFYRKSNQVCGESKVIKYRELVLKPT